MIIKEKMIFWSLLPVLMVISVIGIHSQEKRRESMDEFLKDIEAITEKAKAKKRPAKDILDIATIKTQETIEDYSQLLERSIFFRPASEARPVNKEGVITLKGEEPKKPIFVYKGKMTVGTKLIVIIEDQNTGKSFSVKEGDMAGDFLVSSIGEKEIRLKKRDGEEIVLSTVKEEKRQGDNNANK